MSQDRRSEALRQRVTELEQALLAVRLGGVDSIVSQTSPGDRGTLYHLAGADAPYRVLVETMSDGAVSVTAEGVIIYANGAFADLVGVPHGSLVGSPLLGWTAPDHRALMRQTLDRCLSSGVRQELELRHADGHQIPVLLAYSAAGLGLDLGLNIVVTDLTERRRIQEHELELERQLQNSQKLESLGVLSGGIAHDFNNLLMAMSGQAELALLRLGPEHPAGAHLDKLKRTIRKAADLTRQLLAYTGRSQAPLTPVDLVQVVRDLEPMLRVSLAQNVHLSLDLGPESQWVLGNSAQLDQVVMNLALNGAESLAPEGGEVTFRVHREGPDQVVLEVSDTGCGMDAETQARIFEPFFTTKFTGRGLGLSAVQGIARAHRAVLEVESHPGQGSRFVLTFPLTPGPDAGPDRPGGEECRGSGTVLVVDDELAILEVTESLLLSLGYQVLAAADGTSALALLHAHPEVVAVVLDLILPGLSGAQILAKIRETLPDLPVLLASGHSDEPPEELLGTAGPVAYLSKPYDRQALGAELAALLSRRQV